MPTMEIVNERFARNFRIGLFNFIRRSPEVSVGTVSVQRYSAFLRRLAVPTNFNIVGHSPFARQWSDRVRAFAGVRHHRYLVRWRRPFANAYRRP